MRDVAAERNAASTVFKELYAQIRTPGEDYHDKDFLRNLTAKEWKKVKRLIKQHDFPCTLKSTNFGFSFALRVLAHSDALPEAHPELDTLLVIERSQFPFPREFGADLCKALKVAFAFVQRPRNIQLLTFYKQKVPKDIHAYVY